MKHSHLNSLVLRNDETNALWLKLDILARQMELACERENAQRIREAMANVAYAQFTLTDLLQTEKAERGGVA